MTKIKEKDVLFDHNYDGIQELDNDLPPWWLWLFYLTIIWGVLYLVHYHVIGTGDLSAEEYEKEVNPAFVENKSSSGFSIGYSSPFYMKGEELTPLRRVQIALAEEKEAALLLAEKKTDSEQIKLEDISFNEILLAAMRVASAEDLEKLKSVFPDIYTAYLSAEKGAPAPSEVVPVAKIEPLSDSANLAAGESIFISNCITCHGKLGEGGIGPNMTDDYFIHGAGLGDIVKVINSGVPAKGMIAWRGILNEEQIRQVASYVLTLHGTNPPNAKAPQGEKVESAAN
jgi:mono/diheme cytochrome c family protein